MVNDEVADEGGGKGTENLACGFADFSGDDADFIGKTHLRVSGLLVGVFIGSCPTVNDFVSTKET